MLLSGWLKDFKCIGDKCEDTCCKGWGMQVDEATIARYKKHAPELMEFVTSGEADHIMKRDEKTDYCSQFDKGWCKIHSSKGEEFLGDACHLFPRVTRQIGKVTIQTATLSCPEITRMALLNEANDDWHETSEDVRLPSTLKNYLPDNLDEDKALQIHQLFLQAALAEDASDAQIIARLHSISKSLMMVDINTWAMATEFYIKSADSRLMNKEPKTEDPFHIYHAVAGLKAATRQSNRPRLDEVLDNMRVALDIKTNEETGEINFGNNSLNNLTEMNEKWQFVNKEWQPYFKRFIRAQIGMALFPFSGFGETLTDKITIIGVRLATLKLAMKCHLFTQKSLTTEDALKITQSLARFLDHLADPELSMQIYNETGWVKTDRLWGLLD